MAFADRPRGWERTTKRILLRDGFVCWMCGKAADTVDHIVPRSKGGSHDDANLRAACRSCNSRRGNRATVPIILPLSRPSRWR